jgi:ABC-2 type transport system ATP-binding protein
LRFRRPEDVVAVDSVTLQIRQGELFGLLGPNGAGKTTLIKLLCNLILPSEGRALVCGRDVVREAGAVKPLIGLVDCQERSFYWRLTGRQNLRFFAALYDLYGAAADGRIGELLDLVGLREHADRCFMDYSTGMRQRLALARGLLSMPRVLFMDEPTRSLDPVKAHELRVFIRGVLVEKLGCTVLLVTHDLEEAETLCDRVAIMDEGQIIACGSPAEIEEHITARSRYHIRVRNLPGSALDALKALPGVVQLRWETINPHGTSLDLVLADEDRVLPAVLHCIVSEGGEITRCHAQRVSLEEIFVRLVGEDGNGLP